MQHGESARNRTGRSISPLGRASDGVSGTWSDAQTSTPTTRHARAPHGMLLLACLAAAIIASANAQSECVETAQLTDRQEILDTIQRFAWAIDTKKPLSDYPGALGEVFTEDLQFGFARGGGVKPSDIKLNPMGLAQKTAFIAGVQQKYEATQHLCSNTEIVFSAPDAASAKTMARNYHMKKPEHGGGMYEFYGMYEDELVKLPQGWRIKARKLVPFFDRGEVAPNPK